MTAVIDTGDEIIHVPHADVEGVKKNKDGSTTFKLIGGLYHGLSVRIYGPFERVVFKCSTGVHVYVVNPPLKKNGKWVYVYDPLDKTEYTEAERTNGAG